MFRTTPSWFADLPVGRKLALGFGAIIALTLLVGGIALVTGDIRENARLAAVKQVEDATLGQHAYDNWLAARRHEKDFMLRYRDEGYDSAFQNYALTQQTSIGSTLDQIKQLRGTTETGNFARLDQATQFITTYSDSFNLVVDEVKQRGVEEQSGVVNAAFQSVENLETAANNAGAGTVHDASHQVLAALWAYDIVMLPGNQVKDPQKAIAAYQQAKGQVNDSLNAVSSQVAFATLSDTDRSLLQSATDKAKNAVNDLTTLDGQLLENRNTFQTTVDQSEPPLKDAIQFELDQAAASGVYYDQVQNFARVAEIVFVALAVLVSIGLTLIVTGSLTRQIDALKPVFSAVRIGNFDTRASVLSQDELGRATRDINDVLDYMANLLRGESARTENIVTSAPDAIILVNQERNIILFNPAAESIFGIPRTTAIGMPVSQIAPKLLQLMSSHAQSGNGQGANAMRQGVDLFGVRSDGTQIPMEGTISPVEVGGETLFTVILRDITIRQELQANVTQMVTLLVSQAASSATMAEQATTSALEGSEAVTATIAAMGRIRDNTQDTARRIKRLGEVSSEIGEAVRLIEELADRTTVLALNASIQAASAGEAGRGFAVVAEEVQRLAERATGTTRQIEGLVKNIQAEMSEAVIGIEEATREVVDGSTLAQQTGDRVGDLSRLVSDLASLIQHVAATTATQTTASLAALTSGVMAEESASGGNGHGTAVPIR